VTAAIASFKGEYEFLSNFFDHDDGMTVEHYFQAAKTDDPRWIARILSAATPGQAKRLGRQCVLRPTWDVEKDAVMLTLLMVKFSDPDLAEKLLATGDAELIEGNDWGDRYWGVCRGVGQNRLGELLMRVRDAASRHDARWRA
jgi:ribA/ribD-fused uncharacterized protein